MKNKDRNLQACIILMTKIWTPKNGVKFNTWCNCTFIFFKNKTLYITEHFEFDCFCFSHLNEKSPLVQNDAHGVIVTMFH